MQVVVVSVVAVVQVVVVQTTEQVQLDFQELLYRPAVLKTAQLLGQLDFYYTAVELDAIYHHLRPDKFLCSILASSVHHCIVQHQLQVVV